MSLKEKAIKGSKVTLIGEFTLAASRFVSIPIYARFVSPDDYGLLAIAASLSVLINIMMEGGLSTATLQRKQISEIERSSLHWLNTGIGLMGLILLCAISPLINIIYGETEFLYILPCYGLLCLMRSSNVQRNALLQRDLRFQTLVRINISSQLAGTVIGLILAIQGFGYWSIIAMELSAITLAIVQTRIALPWRPRLKYSHKAAKPLISFGLPLMLSNLLNNLTKGIDVLLLGYFQNTVQVGLYSRSNRIIKLPLDQAIGPITGVIRPILFNKANADNESFVRNVYLIASLMASAGAAIAMASVAFAEQIVRIMLGDQWLDAIPIVLALAPFIFAVPVFGMLNEVIIARGNSKPVLKWKVFSSIILVITVAISVHWGALGLAIGASASGVLIRAPLFILYTAKHAQLSAKKLYLSLLPATTAMFTAFPLTIYFYQAGYTQNIWHAALAGSSTLALFSCVYILFPSGRKTITEAILIVKPRRKPKNHSSDTAAE